MSLNHAIPKNTSLSDHINKHYVKAAKEYGPGFNRIFDREFDGREVPTRFVHGELWRVKDKFNLIKQAFFEAIKLYYQQLHIVPADTAKEIECLKETLQAFNIYQEFVADIIDKNFSYKNLSLEAKNAIVAKYSPDGTLNAEAIKKKFARDLALGYVSHDLTDDRIPQEFLESEKQYTLLTQISVYFNKINREEKDVVSSNSAIKEIVQAASDLPALSRKSMSMFSIFDQEKATATFVIEQVYDRFFKMANTQFQPEKLTNLPRNKEREEKPFQRNTQTFMPIAFDIEATLLKDATKISNQLSANASENVFNNQYVQKLMPLASNIEAELLNQLSRLPRSKLEAYIAAYIANLEPTDNHRQFNGHCQLLGILVKAAIEKGCEYKKVSKLLEPLAPSRLDYLKRMDEVVLEAYTAKLLELKVLFEADRNVLVNQLQTLENKKAEGLRYVVLPVYLEDQHSARQQDGFDDFSWILKTSLVETSLVDRKYDCKDLSTAKAALALGKDKNPIFSTLIDAKTATNNGFENAIRDRSASFSVKPVYFILEVSKDADLSNLQQNELKSITRLSYTGYVSSESTFEDQGGYYGIQEITNYSPALQKQSENTIPCASNDLDKKIAGKKQEIEAHDKKHRYVLQKISGLIEELTTVKNELAGTAEEQTWDRAGFEEKIKSVEALIIRLNRFNLEYQTKAERPTDKDISEEIKAWKQHGAAKTLAHERNPVSQFYHAIASVFGIEKGKTATEKAVDKALTSITRKR